MKRSTWILLAVCACSLLTMACKNTAEVKRRILEMQQHDICLPLSEFMLCTTDDEKAKELAQIENARLKLVVYVNSSVCSPCLMKNMYHWYDVIDKAERRCGEELKVVFIFQISPTELKGMQLGYMNSAFSYPVFLDTAETFLDNNSFIPKESQYHTFLMDGNRVVFVGSPLINDRLNDLFWEVVDDHMVP